MTPERWREITELFHRALPHNQAARRLLLEEACAHDRALLDEVAALLDAHHNAGARDVWPIRGLDQHDNALAPGEIIGRYRIERLLGHGGMGSVFLAYDTTLHRQIALKVLNEPADEAASRAKLLREARSAAALNHPNICTIHEVGEANGTAFIAMEYVDGRSLREILDQGPVPLTDAVRYAIQAADALGCAHEHGVVHGDFKAANVIVTQAGRLTIVDFGLARRRDPVISKATTVSSLPAVVAGAGTPYAMAPEQVRGEIADERTDLWALGVLLHEMVSGGKPFDAGSPADLFSSILRDAPAALPDTAPAALRTVIERCLAKDPERRYHHAREAHAALAAPEVAASIVPARRRSLRPTAIVVATAIGVAVSLVGLNIGGLRDRLRGAPPEGAPITLAVLPFENLTGDSSQEYFSDGLTEELISQLGRLSPERLRVIARTSSMRYKHSNVPVDQIGSALAADYVMEGSARREGGRVRISATLIRVRDQTQRWTNTFERELAGILGLQSDVAEAVAGSLAVALLPEAKRALGAAKPVDPEAYEAYLAGRSHATRLTPADLDTAEKYFEQALARDPKYAFAHVGLSLVWSGRQQMQFVPPAEAGPRVRAEASKALELDETLPEAHLQLGNTYTWTDWNWSVAEPEFRRAIELRPNYAEARAFYSHYLYIMRRPAEAQEQIRRALELDPLSEFVQSLSAASLFMARRFDEAEAQLRNALKTNPNSPMALTGLSETLHYLRRYDEALAVERTRWTARGDREIDEALRRGSEESGYAGAMRRAADAQAVRSKSSGILPVAVAKLYARAGGPSERELDWLEKAVETRDPNVPYIGAMPIFDHLHGTPRFQRLLTRLNLPK